MSHTSSVECMRLMLCIFFFFLHNLTIAEVGIIIVSCSDWHVLISNTECISKTILVYLFSPFFFVLAFGNYFSPISLPFCLWNSAALERLSINPKSSCYKQVRNISCILFKAGAIIGSFIILNEIKVLRWNWKILKCEGSVLSTGFVYLALL